MTDPTNDIPEEFETELEAEMASDPVVDPTQVITLRTSGGDTRYIPTSEPLTLAEVKAMSQLTFGAVQFYLNAAVIDDDTILPVGSTIAVVGNVKGGF